MTEAEIVFQYSEYVNRVWSLLQWWGSVSLGLIALAHLASDRLNSILLFAILSLYTSYSILLMVMLSVNVTAMGLLIEDLTRLANEGVAIGNYASNLIEADTLGPILGLIVALGTYFSSMLYPIFALRQQRSLSKS